MPMNRREMKKYRSERKFNLMSGKSADTQLSVGLWNTMNKFKFKNDQSFGMIQLCSNNLILTCFSCNAAMFKSRHLTNVAKCLFIISSAAS